MSCTLLEENINPKKSSLQKDELILLLRVRVIMNPLKRKPTWSQVLAQECLVFQSMIEMIQEQFKQRNSHHMIMKTHMTIENLMIGKKRNLERLFLNILECLQEKYKSQKKKLNKLQ